ncbi:MAG: PP2C family protein-serine/threonine phosphatase [bacterium]|nr:PP2C family protein-serine/threonine phosphatase [bacterium]
MNEDAKNNNNEFHDPDNFALEFYITTIVHEWSKTLAFLVYTLVPFFVILDYFTMPPEHFKQFIVYRAVSTALAIGQYIIIKNTKPGKLSYLHGYITSLVVGGTISMMTVDLGGFDHGYYAGLNLVIIAVNMLLPWGAFHSAVNGSITILIYLLLNFITPQPYGTQTLANNLFFLSSTVIIAVSINYLRQKLLKQEFLLRTELKKARDALWGEMSIAKKIQTSLLPNKHRIGNYQVASTMIPAEEVGGDYYDIIESDTGEKWIGIGDVSGHGVESGLIMMMTQTSLLSMLNSSSGYKPSQVLEYVNAVIRKNISKLRSSRYMTILAIKLEESRITMAGKHQDLMIYRTRIGEVEVVPTTGTWLGITDNIGTFLVDHSVNMEIGDFFLLFTDGITEAMDKDGEMFGEERLKETLLKYADLTVAEIVKNIIQDVIAFQEEQNDDISLLVIKKIF